MDICIDSNILIYAFNARSQFNAKAEAVLEKLIRTDGFAITDISLIEFYQIITNDKVVSDAISPDKAYKIIKNIGILQIEGKVVYTFWQAVFRQSSGTSHNGGFSFFFCAGSYTGEREKDLSFSRMTSKSRSTQSFFCFFPVNISMGVWFFLLPAL